MTSTSTARRSRMPIRDREWVRLRLTSGMTVTALAAEAGVSRQTAHSWLSRHRLARPVRVRPSGDVLADLYRRHGSVAAVAVEVAAAPSTAHRWLIDAGVAVRRPGTGRPPMPLDVDELRRRVATGAPVTVVADELGVSLATSAAASSGSSADRRPADGSPRRATAAMPEMAAARQAKPSSANRSA